MYLFVISDFTKVLLAEFVALVLYFYANFYF